MKGLAKRLSLVVCAAVMVFAGCGNPWMKRITASLYDKPQGPEVPGTAENPTVTLVTVNPSTAAVAKGDSLQFIAVVYGTGSPAQTVTWSITGAVSSETTIFPDGLLTVAMAETATSLTVQATSTADPAVSGTATVMVSDLPFTVTGVTVSPMTANVGKGATQQFSAVVNGTGSPEQTVTWSVEGAVSSGTSISAAGLLTVVAAETASTLTVRATSTVDTGKSGTAAVTVTVPGMDDEDFGIGIVPDQIFDVTDAAGWAAALAGITSPGNYVINLTGNISVTSLPVYPVYTFGTVSGITVSLRGGGSLAYTGSGYASLFTVTNGQELIIRDFTLQGDTNNGWALLEVHSGGTAILKTGGKITGNIASATMGSGGVTVTGGTFIMEGGEISGNTSTGGSGGGVYISGSGTFTMSGGEIKGNTASLNKGGGVYVDGSATFTKTGGTIYGGSDIPPNTADGGSPGSGHAVYTGAEGGKRRDDTVSDNISVSGGVCGGTWYGIPI